MSYAPLTADNRCDRCGSQAYVVTAHGKSTLMWCAHHYRLNRDALAPDVIHDETHRLLKEALVKA